MAVQTSNLPLNKKDDDPGHIPAVDSHFAWLVPRSAWDRSVLLLFLCSLFLFLHALLGGGLDPAELELLRAERHAAGLPQVPPLVKLPTPLRRCVFETFDANDPSIHIQGLPHSIPVISFSLRASHALSPTSVSSPGTAEAVSARASLVSLSISRVRAPAEEVFAASTAPTAAETSTEMRKQSENRVTKRLRRESFHVGIKLRGRVHGRS